MQSASCQICNGPCGPSRCVELWAPLRDGFFKGGGGGGGHSHDDDDEKVDMVPTVFGAVIKIEEDFDLTNERNEQRRSRSRVRNLL